jgi:hypothetical protein
MKIFKNTLFYVLLFAGGLIVNAQEMYVSLWYGQIQNKDVSEHIELEREYYSNFWQHQIDEGNIMGWDMWQILNSDVNEMTTTFVYATLHSEPTFTTSSLNSMKGKSSSDRKAAEKRAMSHYIKNKAVTTSVKGGYGPQLEPGGVPTDIAVINYMAVDPYKADEYEKAELEMFMPNFKENDKIKTGWGLHKILNYLGTDHPVNYMTVDFYNSLNDLYEVRNATGEISDEAEEFWRGFDEIRTLKNSHILRKVMVLR